MARTLSVALRERTADFLGSESLRSFAAILGALVILHAPLLRLPYFWDEAGYYIPAAWDLYHSGSLIPQSTLPTGHPPLVMVYLALAWSVFGCSPLVTRLAMLLVAAGCVTTLYLLGKRVAGREAGIWSALLLALCPLFFAQSSMAHLDLAAALFSTLGILALLEDAWWRFALWGSLAVLSKETAVVLLPVAWVFVYRKAGARHRAIGARRPAPQGSFGAPRRVAPLHAFASVLPLLPLAAWTIYYHHATGFWTGNSEYLRYNLFSTLYPARIVLTLLRRLYEVFLGGFHWLLLAGALAGVWRHRRVPRGETSANPGHWPTPPVRDFLFLALGLTVLYVLMLSLVGGAILPRYLLPIFPSLILVAVIFLFRLPRRAARGVCVLAAGCFIWAWFINPPYPFPFEDNLAYADFIRLQLRAVQYLERQPAGVRILTAWPASDELAKPLLGYLRRPLAVVPVQSFADESFINVKPGSFDLLCLYSRQWEPEFNVLRQWPRLLILQERYFNYRPQVAERALLARLDLKLLAEYRERGQWVRIYAAPGYHCEGREFRHQETGPRR